MLDRIRNSNRGREAFWMLVLLGCTACNIMFVNSQYEGIGHPDSMGAFMWNFIFAAFAIFVLTLLWWGIVTTETPAFLWLRMGLEHNAAVCAFVFSLLAWLITGTFFFRNHIIYSYDERVTYSLYCVMMLPSAFTCLMYFRPPVQIAKVILPLSGFWYWLERIVLILAALAFSVWCFWDNFVF